MDLALRVAPTTSLGCRKAVRLPLCVTVPLASGLLHLVLAEDTAAAAAVLGNCSGQACGDTVPQVSWGSRCMIKPRGPPGRELRLPWASSRGHLLGQVH